MARILPLNLMKKKRRLSPRRRGRPIVTGCRISRWIDSSTALLYAHSGGAFDMRNQIESAAAASFFTLKFDSGGRIMQALISRSIFEGARSRNGPTFRKRLSKIRLGGV